VPCTSALEHTTRPIVAALYPRRCALKNRERLNRLLTLMQFHVNGDDDVKAYATAARARREPKRRPPHSESTCNCRPRRLASLR
jgi:hypothetical protein